MPRKGFRCIIKLGALPNLTLERNPDPTSQNNFKDNKKYIDAPPPASAERPVDVPLSTEDHLITLDEFYGTLDKEKHALSQKQTNIRSNPALRSREVAKMSRKIAKGLNFINNLKESTDTNPLEGIDAVQEGEGLAQAGSLEDFQDAAQEWTGAQGFEAAAEEAEAGAQDSDPAAEEAEAGAQDSDPAAEEAEAGAQELEAVQAGLDL